MVKREFTFPSADGKTAIHAVEWLPEGAPRAVLQIAHGVSEYVLRYEDFAGYLTERGFAVVGNDHLGHGLSVSDGAPRLYFGPKGSWNWVVEDMEQLRKLTHRHFPNLPYFLLGHSMGSFLTRTYLIRYPGTLYTLLDSFQAAGWIMETKTEGRRRSYLITPAGEQALAEEYQRLQILSEDYRSYMGRRGEIES